MKISRRPYYGVAPCSSGPGGCSQPPSRSHFYIPGCEAAAQVFEVAAGASTAYGAEGASVVIHGQNTLTTFGAGLVGGHFAAGGSAIRPISGGSLTVGQQLFRMDVPTDVFDTTHVFFGTGAGIKMKREQGSSLEAFAGVSSQEGGHTSLHHNRLERPLSLRAVDSSPHLRLHHRFDCVVVSAKLRQVAEFRMRKAQLDSLRRNDWHRRWIPLRRSQCRHQEEPFARPRGLYLRRQELPARQRFHRTHSGTDQGKRHGRV